MPAPYQAPDHILTDGPLHEFNFGIGAMSLDPDTPVTILLKSVVSSAVVDVGKPINLVFQGGSSSFARPGHYGANYTISRAGSNFSATWMGDNNPGTLQITGLPVGSSAGVSWYQMEVGSSGTAAHKVFNLYETVNSGGLILNPAYTSASQAGALAIDGLATVSAQFAAGTVVGSQQYVSGIGAQVQVNFQNGGNNSLDPSLMTVVPLSAAVPNAYLQPFAPVVGMRPGYTEASGAPFLEAYQVWNVQSTSQTVSGNTTRTVPVTNPVTVYNGGLVFGWNGADSAAVQQRAALGSSFVSAYTNKTNGDNIARLVFSATTGSLPTEGLSSSGTGASTIYYTTATADSDGVWATDAPIQFANGTYTVQMQEFLPTDSGFANPLNSASVVQSFTVQQGAVISNGQHLAVSSGQTSNGLTVDSGGTLTVLSGGTAIGTFISAGGSAHTVAGNGDSGTIVLGYHGVWSGATASGTTVGSGGRDYVYGSTTDVSVNGGGVQVVGGGGDATEARTTGTLLNSGSHQHVKSAGTASGTVVFSGGVLAVDSSGTAVSMSAYSGGLVHVSSGGTLSGGAMFGATLEVFAGGSAGGGLTLNNGSGLLQVWAGGATDASVTLNSGNHMFILSGATAAGTANAGARIVVSSGGSAGGGATANLNGEIHVSAGGWALPTLNGGKLWAYEGATVNLARVTSGGALYVGGVGAQTSGSNILSGSYEHIYGGAAAISSTVSGGEQKVWGSGTTATSTSVVSSGGSSGAQYVYSAASAVGTQVSSGGRLWAWEVGTTVKDATISAGGEMVIHRSAVASGAQLEGGIVKFYNGGQGSVQINASSSIVEVGVSAGTVNVSGFAVSTGAIDFSNMSYDASVTSAWTQLGVGSGTLTLTSGSLQAAVTLFGTFSAASDFTYTAHNNGTRVTDNMAGTDIQNLISPPQG